MDYILFYKKLENRKTFITVIVLYIIGLLGDSYYGLTRNVCVLVIYMILSLK